MRFEVILASLVAFVAAAPVEMASDGSYGKYTLYSSYTPYGNYGTAAEAAAAKMQIEAVQTKRLAARLAAGNAAGYKSYTPYKSYGAYPGGMESEAAKMDMAKRHDMVMTEAMMQDASTMEKDMKTMEDTTRDTMKRYIPSTPEMAGDGSYVAYIPYSSYGSYPKATTAEGAMDMMTE